MLKQISTFFSKFVSCPAVPVAENNLRRIGCAPPKETAAYELWRAQLKETMASPHVPFPQRISAFLALYNHDMYYASQACHEGGIRA